jgi:dTDP-4-amino-4,6-dideoxygalactose transaminase
MKIKYIQDKSVDYNLVQKYLDISKTKNHWTNNGPVKSLLEDKIAEMINLPSGKKVLMATNGTVALHGLMFYYDMKSGYDLKYISPSFTFPSCVVNESNTAVCDINEKYCLDESTANGFDGVIVTNLFGTICDFQAKNKLIIYDNASSFMSTYNNKNISLMGNASFSSLHHTKYLGFGEGGFLVINSKDYDDIQRILGFGFSADRQHKDKIF